MKKLFSALLAIAMMFSVTGCGSSDGGSDDKMRIAMITDSGDITDQSFNQITYETCKKYSKDKGLDFKYYKPTEDTDKARIAKVDKAVEDGYNVIVMPGFLFAEAISYASIEYPDVKFVGIDISEGDMLGTTSNGKGSKKLEDHYNTENTYLTVYQEEIPGYMAGYAAVKMGYTKLGFLGGIAVPAVIRYGYGFVQGANDAAKELGTTVDCNYTYGGQFYGDTDITGRMDTWYQNGTEVVFACGGGIYTSACEAATKTNGHVIGVDVDQHDLIAKDYNKDDMCVTSAMKDLGQTITTLLDAIQDGKFKDFTGKIDNLGLGKEGESDYVGLAPKTQYNDKFSKDDYEALIKKIKAGEVKISNDIEKMPAVTNVNVDDQGNIK